MFESEINPSKYNREQFQYYDKLFEKIDKSVLARTSECNKRKISRRDDGDSGSYENVECNKRSKPNNYHPAGKNTQNLSDILKNKQVVQDFAPKCNIKNLKKFYNNNYYKEDYYDTLDKNYYNWNNLLNKY